MTDLILPTEEQVDRAAHERRLGGKPVCAVCGVPVERGCINPNHFGVKIVPTGEPSPVALTDSHAAALERAIRAEGFEILTDTETGEIKLERKPAPERKRAECPHCRADLEDIREGSGFNEKVIHHCPEPTAADGGHTEVSYIWTAAGEVEIHQRVNGIIPE